MKVSRSKGGILRIRPGHLANFSGGAGYMPFIVMLSVPASFLFGVIAWFFLHFRGKPLLDRTGPGFDLHEFVRYARRHTAVCFLVAAVSGAVLFFLGQRMVYGDKWQYALLTIVFAVGPMGAWVLSSVVLMLLMERRGASRANLLVAVAVYGALLIGCIPLLWIVSAVTGARL